MAGWGGGDAPSVMPSRPNSVPSLLAVGFAFVLQHPNKDEPAGVQPQQQHSFMPRARGREYKRQPDHSVVLNLVAADADQDAPEGQQQPQPSGKGIGGDYDGSEVMELHVSGIPNLPPDTIGPPSPQHGVPDSSGMGQQQLLHGGLPPPPPGFKGQADDQQLQLQQQHSGLQRRQSSASVGLELLGADDDSQGLRPAGSGGIRPAASGELQQSECRAWVRAGRWRRQNHGPCRAHFGLHSLSLDCAIGFAL